MIRYKNPLTTVVLAAMATSTFLISGCATTEGTEQTFDVPRPNYGQQAPVKETRNSQKAVPTSSANPTSNSLPTDGNLMRHSLRQIVEYDTYKMTKLVNREINLKDEDNESFLGQVAVTLGQTVMLQPHFTEREDALKELKSKVDQEDYILVVERAANDLLLILRTSPTPSDQAGAFIALTNLVTEVRTLKRPELREVLQKIADANLVVTAQAKQYAKDPMEKIISPSDEAQSALKTL